MKGDVRTAPEVEVDQCHEELCVVSTVSDKHRKLLCHTGVQLTLLSKC